MRFPVSLDQDKVSRFLDCLTVAFREFGEWHGRGAFHDDGQFSHTTIFQLRASDGRIIPIEWTTNWNLDGTLAPFEVSSPSDEPDSAWTPIIERMIREALIASINSDTAKIFSHHTFAYMGQPLDGEFYLPGRIRIAPGNLQFNSFISERIIYIDQEIVAVTESAAHELAKIEATRYASILSLILDIGIYPIPIEARWVRLSKDDGSPVSEVSECLYLGYIDNKPAPTAMPQKGQLCKLGATYTADRSRPEKAVSYGETIKYPSDIRHLFRGIQSLTGLQRQAFLGSVALYQIAQVQGRYLPTLRLAYEVAAVEALREANLPTLDSFSAIMQKYVPEVSLETRNLLYGDVRSAHFHSGAFPAGEFARFNISPFGTREHLLLMNLQTISHQATRLCIIRWILDRIPSP